MVNMTPDQAYYICYYRKRRILELEPIIITDPEYSYFYAINIIKGPFKKGEDIISKDSTRSYQYARDIKKGRFPKGEKSIIKDPKLAYWYCKLIINFPLEEAHPVILKSMWKEDYIDYLKEINYDLNKIKESELLL